MDDSLAGSHGNALSVFYHHLAHLVGTECPHRGRREVHLEDKLEDEQIWLGTENFRPEDECFQLELMKDRHEDMQWWFWLRSGRVQASELV